MPKKPPRDDLPGKHTPAWKLLLPATELQRQIARREHCEHVITNALLAAGKDPYEVLSSFRPRRGRPLRHPHPLPRRDPKPGEILDPKTHRETHQANKVYGCERCYSREFQYFLENPEKIPPGQYDDIAGRENPWGMPKYRRPWLDEGWQEDWDKMVAEERAKKLKPKKK